MEIYEFLSHDNFANFFKFFRENNALKGLSSKMASANSIFYQVGANERKFELYYFAEEGFDY